MVRYNFPQADAGSFMAGLDRAVAKLEELHKEDHVCRAAAMDDALRSVLGVWLLAQCPASSSWEDEKHRAFQAHVLHILRLHRSSLATWLARLDIALWQRDREGWYKASMGRSAAEIVASAIDDGQEAPLVPSHWLEETDEEMREIGPGINALPPEVIPRGIPASHWWWFLPSGPAQPDNDTFA